MDFVRGGAEAQIFIYLKIHLKLISIETGFSFINLSLINIFNIFRRRLLTSLILNGVIERELEVDTTRHVSPTMTVTEMLYLNTSMYVISFK